MASRKRKPDSPQIGLSFGGPNLPPPYVEPRTGVSEGQRSDTLEAADLGRVTAASALASITPIVEPSEAGTIDLESFDDYDDSQTIEDVPRLRLVDPPRHVAIIVEAIDGNRYEVCRLRDNGTTVASVFYSRKELEELYARVGAALEM